MGASQFISPSINVLKDLINALTTRSRSNNIHKKLVIREIRDNLKRLARHEDKKLSLDLILDQLENTAYTEAIKSNFDFRKLKKGKIKQDHIIDKRNNRYLGWTSEQLIDKIDEKIEELRSMQKLYGSLNSKDKNYRLMISNLFYRVKLLAEFIHEKK